MSEFVSRGSFESSVANSLRVRKVKIKAQKHKNFGGAMPLMHVKRVIMVHKALKKFLCFLLPSVPKKPASLKFLLDF